MCQTSFSSIWRSYVPTFLSGYFANNCLQSLVARLFSFGSDLTLLPSISNFCGLLGSPVSTEKKCKCMNSLPHQWTVRKSHSWKSPSRSTGHLHMRVLTAVVRLVGSRNPAAPTLPQPLLQCCISTASEHPEHWVCRALALHCKAGSLSLLWQAGRPPGTFPV